MDPLTLQAAMHKRGGDAGMLFRDEIRAKLGAFNPWMSTDVIRQVRRAAGGVPLRKGICRRCCRLARISHQGVGKGLPGVA